MPNQALQQTATRSGFSQGATLMRRAAAAELCRSAGGVQAMFRRDGLFLVLLALGAMTISGCGKPPPRQPLAGAASGAISISARAIDIAQLQKVKPGMTVAQVEEILGPGEVVEPERTIPPGELIAIAGKSDKPRTYKSLQWKVIINGEPYRVMLPFIDGTSPVSYAHTVKKLTDYFGVHLGH